MKRTLAASMILTLFTAGSAWALDVAPHLGERFYGLYMNGEKAGYSSTVLEETPDGGFVLRQSARFLVLMGGVEQDMRTMFERRYCSDQRLQELNATVDAVSRSEFHAAVEGDELVLTTKVGDAVGVQRLPRPEETLADMLRLEELVRSGAKISQTVAFGVFDPMLQQTLEGTSRVAGVETRLLHGVATEVYEVHTHIATLGLDTVAYVAQDGTVLEDVTGGFLTMRLEPEEIAKDVSYSNDTIIANAARITAPIPNARTRDRLDLRITGPLEERHLFQTRRQELAGGAGTFYLRSAQVNLAAIEPATLPIEREDLAEWLEPTLFIQSDHPDVVAKSREVAGDARDALHAAQRLSTWVSDNVKTTFSAQLSNTLEVLRSLEGDCTEHSVLFVGLARAAGIPAREVAGLIYVEGPSPGFYFHQWAEVWVGEWIEVDPTFNQLPADVTHVKLAEGDLFEQTKLLPIIGRLEVEVVESSEESS